MTLFKFEYRVYKRPFRKALSTAHGVWKVREGIIIKLEDENARIGCGEIAPLAWFGSETLEDAVRFCEGIGNRIGEEEIYSIVSALPACQFGFESALENLEKGEYLEEPENISYLLPAGESVLDSIDNIRPGNTYKWKIGVGEPGGEIKVFEKLIDRLPGNIKLRLDANGGLNFETARRWLEITDNIGTIEFIEQPLGVGEWKGMLELSRCFSTVIALDESISTLARIEDYYLKGWRGVYVIKPAIVGSPRGLRSLLDRYNLDTVFSSVFETSIGRRSALRYGVEYSKNCRALGFGVGKWFRDDGLNF